MPAQDFAAGGDEFAGSCWGLLALLFEIGGDELLVVATGNETDFLRIGLFGESEAGSAG